MVQTAFETTCELSLPVNPVHKETVFSTVTKCVLEKHGDCFYSNHTVVFKRHHFTKMLSPLVDDYFCFQ